MRHVESFVIKLPIGFLCMTSRIILKHHPDIMNQGDVKKKKGMPLTFDRKLFMGTHVQDNVVTTMSILLMGVLLPNPNP